MRILYWAIRIPLGVVIALAGIGKLASLSGFVGIIHTYQLSLPNEVAWVIAVGVAVFELSLGLWMLSGYAQQRVAVLSIAMHTGYAVLLTVTLLRGIPLENCGCFGVFHAEPLHWYTPLQDVALIGISYILLDLSRKFASNKRLTG